MNKEDICNICLNNIINNNSFKTKCNHIFHKDCIEKWCSKNNNCPTCRNENIIENNLNILIPESPNILRDSPLYYDENSLTPRTETTVSQNSPDTSDYNNITTLHNIIEDVNNELHNLELNNNINYITRFRSRIISRCNILNRYFNNR